MEGNSNEAMATAVESAKTVVVFLSEPYQKSDNCKLELFYALYCAKPIIFIKVQQNMKIEQWMKEIIDENYMFEVYSLEDLTIVTNNISKSDRIAQAIRDVGAPQSDIEDYDLSDEVFNLKQILNEALDEIASNTGKVRFKTCTRCKKEYEEDNPIGCKAHSAYYVGGNIIAGRWVCCMQQNKNAEGCSNANHTDANLKWTCNPDYGTYTWA